MRHFKLTGDQKSCIVSAYKAGLTYREIGDVANSTEHTVRRYIRSLELPPRPPGRPSKGVGEPVYEPAPFPKVDPMMEAFAANPALGRAYRLGVRA